MGSVARSLYLLSTTLLKPDLQNTLSWKGPIKDHRVQLLAPHRATQRLDHMSESVVQTLLVLQ